jgi:nucleolin
MAFASFDVRTSAEKAAELNEEILDGRWLKIALANGIKKNFKIGNQRPRSEPASIIFVGNLPYSVDSDVINNFFLSKGYTLLEVRLPWDHEKQRSKGIAYIECADVPTAIKIVDELDGAFFKGRYLRLDFSVPSNNDNKLKRSY